MMVPSSSLEYLLEDEVPVEVLSYALVTAAPLSSTLGVYLRTAGHGPKTIPLGCRYDLEPPSDPRRGAFGKAPQQLLVDLVGGDNRFFTASPQREPGDFNYNDNSMLSEAIRAGARGTFWDILRRLITAEIRT